MGFPTKNDHFEVFWGYHHLRKHSPGEMIRFDHFFSLGLKPPTSGFPNLLREICVTQMRKNARVYGALPGAPIPEQVFGCLGM